MTAVYRVLCGLLGLGFLGGGLAFVAGYFQAAGPGATATGPLSPLGPNGLYFMAFTGCGMVAWGGGLLSLARRPHEAGWFAGFTVFALVLMAAYRMAGWFLGDIAHLGSLPLTEATIFLVLALALVWLRPRSAAAA